MSPRHPTGVRRTASGFYEARWYDAAGRRHSACFDSAAEADAYRQEMLRTRRRGGSGDPSGGKMTVAEWMERWMAGMGNRATGQPGNQVGLVLEEVEVGLAGCHEGLDRFESGVLRP